eukprot:COSAG05_NODE_23609_length_257_cov_0.506329_1_plen_33_part_01
MVLDVFVMEFGRQCGGCGQRRSRMRCVWTGAWS